MKVAAMVLAMITLLAGTRAAYVWHQASRVQVVPMWVEQGRMEPLDGQAQSEWIVAIIDYANRSGDLNRRAAAWTAIAVLLSTVSAVISAL